MPRGTWRAVDVVRTAGASPGRAASTLPRVRSAYHTPRLHLRAWDPADAPAFKAAVDASLGHLRPWLPWAAHEPSPLEAIAERLAAFAQACVDGHWWGYGVFARDGADAGAGALIGSVSLHPPRRPGQPPSVREISYWLRAGATGRGYMTEAAGALTDAALAEPGVLAVQILVDPDNRASVRVPERLGFALREHRVADRLEREGGPRDTLVWERRAHPWRLRPAVTADVPRLAAIRGLVRENRLSRPGCVTTADYHATVEGGLCWVWEDEAGVQGFAAGEPGGGGHVWALFVDPAAEGRGAGSALLACITDVLWARGHRRLTLATAPGTRAERLYAAAGWTAVGRGSTGDVEFRRTL